MRLPTRGALAAAALLVVAAAPPSVHAQRATPRPVLTAAGLVAGTTTASGVRVFRGVPFAAPPVRELRWRPPQPVRRWAGVRAADRFADQCMQARVFGDMMFRNSGVSEDCLYLNVWTPARTAGERLPVLVYFYGGGFVAGDGSEPRYDGESMARRGIVSVTLGYRLGVFGFFSHPALTAESPHEASGNYALMDQTAALRWVRENIAAFGGDPARVTIAGESAGSFSVSAQMASPTARGLFARAIGESGAFFSTTIATPARAETERRGVAFARSVGATSLAALRALSATELLEASGRPGVARFGPNVDGHFLPQRPAEIYAAGRQARVPLLAGWNSEEMSARALLPEAPTPASARALLERVFAERADDAARVYPVRTAGEALQSVTSLAGDQFIAYSTWKWLEEHGRTSGQPVYRYLYARPRPPLVPAMGDATPGLAGGVVRVGSGSGGAAPAPPAQGAVHSAEIEYALGNLPLNPVFAWTPDDYRVSATMQGYFANFIRTGDPNGAGLPAWPVGTARAGAPVLRARIDAATRAEAEPRARYLFLDGVYARVAARGAAAAPDTAPDTAPDAAPFGDEFDGAAIDRAKWLVYEGPVYNDELQAYVDDTATMRIVHGAAAEGASGGALLIHARARSARRPNGGTAAFVSGRLHGRVMLRSGTIAARMKLPAGAGLWPAFWLLGQGGWPGAGEIDVMENVGDATWVNAALHGPGYSGDTPLVRRDTFPAARNATAWHEYAVTWTRDSVLFRVDGAPFYRVTRREIERYGAPAALDSAKYVILNLAIGGGYPAAVNKVRAPRLGLPPATAAMIARGEAKVLVDWVRVTP